MLSVPLLQHKYIRLIIPGMAAKTVAGPNRNPEASPAANNNAAEGNEMV